MQPSPKPVNRCNQSPTRRRSSDKPLSACQLRSCQGAFRVAKPGVAKQLKSAYAALSTSGAATLFTGSRGSLPAPFGRRDGDAAQTSLRPQCGRSSRSRSRNSASFTASSMVIGPSAMASPFLTMCGSTTVARAGNECTAMDARALPRDGLASSSSPAVPRAPWAAPREGPSSPFLLWAGACSRCAGRGSRWAWCSACSMASRSAASGESPLPVAANFCARD